MGTNADSPSSATPVRSAWGEPLGYEQITALNTAKTLTVPAGAVVAVVVPEAQAVRWRDDGTAPTSSAGMSQPVGVYVVFFGAAQLAALRFIEQTASAKLNVSYYG